MPVLQKKSQIWPFDCINSDMNNTPYIIVCRELDDSPVGRVLFIDEYHADARRQGLLGFAHYLFMFRCEGYSTKFARPPWATPNNPCTRYLVVRGDRTLSIELNPPQWRLKEYANAFFESQ